MPELPVPEPAEPVTEPDEVGVGPWPDGPAQWPTDDRYDPQLLAEGDRRNVVDRYRYWRMAAIVADLDSRRHPLHVAVENLGHDFNIGSVVRTANAFAVGSVHIVGRRRWNRRGAMVTDRYQHLLHHPTVDGLVEWARARDLPLVGIDNVPGSVPIEHRALPAAAVMLFGQESGGLSEPARAACDEILHISQYGSTRSLNVGAAAAVAMHSWIVQHASLVDERWTAPRVAPGS
ncbi:TrmH family RNA methyltransferase [Georgenia sunbinii]|uniref:TrmH family RNA methyltransferase n=1 Tax=Georgenia sunbinii TaxID=3117728 RepID=UPI002F261A9B